jgi:flagellar basal body rod protein FlgC
VNEFGLLDAAARGMDAQRTILDVAARNVAAAQAAVPGRPYARLVATFVPDPAGAPDDADVPVDGDALRALDDAPSPGFDDVPARAAVAIARRPGTGDALTELIAVLDAQRAFEADASVFDTGKRLAERTLDIER